MLQINVSALNATEETDFIVTQQFLIGYMDLLCAPALVSFALSADYFGDISLVFDIIKYLQLF